MAQERLKCTDYRSHIVARWVNKKKSKCLSFNSSGVLEPPQGACGVLFCFVLFFSELLLHFFTLICESTLIRRNSQCVVPVQLFYL